MTDDQKKSQGSLTLIGIGIGSIVAVSMSPGISGLWDCIVGAILIACLMTYTDDSTRKEHDKIFALIWGFCMLMIVGFLIDIFYITTVDSKIKSLPEKYYCLFGVDRPLSIRDSFHLAVWMAGAYIGLKIARRTNTNAQHENSSDPKNRVAD